MSHGVPLLARWESRRAEGAVRGEKDELWAAALDVTRRPADLKSGGDPFQTKSPFFRKAKG